MNNKRIISFLTTKKRPIFLDHKEASNLSYRLQMQERCSEDDYNMIKDIVPMWMEEERVIFFQSYNPMDADVMK